MAGTLVPHLGGSTEEAQINIAHFVTDKMIDFLKNGDTRMNVNIPEIQAPKHPNTHRIIHLHENIPGILAKINKILASYELNIAGQYLKTNEHLGYIITDYAGDIPDKAIEEFTIIKGTIRFDQLY